MIRHFIFVTLFILQVLTSITAIKAQTAQRFSPDAIALLEQATLSYDLNGRRHSPSLDRNMLSRLTKSPELHVRNCAVLMLDLLNLRASREQQSANTQKAIEKQAEKFPQIMAMQIIKSIMTSDSERNDLASVGQLLESIMGSEPQKQVNQALAMSLLGHTLTGTLKNEIRAVAISRNVVGDRVRGVIKVKIENGLPVYGTITITNNNLYALHHCLLIMRLEADRARIQAMANQEDAFGQVILPLFGLSTTTVDGSRMAAKLRYATNALDKGGIVYLPEIPPGGSVTATLANPGDYNLSKGADVSVWCDELSEEHIPVSNWGDYKRALEQSRSYVPGFPTRPRFGNGLGARNNRNDNTQGFKNKTVQINPKVNQTPPQIKDTNVYNIFIGESKQDTLTANGTSYVESLIKTLPNFKAKYFPPTPENDICTYIKSLPSGSKVNLIGYGTGGETAATITLHFAEWCGTSVRMHLLLTVDPISQTHLRYTTLKRYVSDWVDVAALPDVPYKADTTAWLQGRWGLGIQPFVTVCIEARRLHHADFELMMKYKSSSSGQESALTWLLNHQE